MAIIIFFRTFYCTFKAFEIVAHVLDFYKCNSYLWYGFIRLHYVLYVDEGPLEMQLQLKS